MSAKQWLEPISSILFGKTRRALLGLFFSKPDQSFYLREMVRSLQIGQGAIQRELSQLVSAGILTRRREGNLIYYQANRQLPIFSELKSIVLKTVGVAGEISSSLNALSARISVAFIYGSFALGTETRRSDVDLLIIGRVDFREVVSALQEAQSKLQREINSTVYPPKEFQEKIAQKQHFLTSVLTQPKIFIIGDESELEKLGAKRMAR